MSGVHADGLPVGPSGHICKHLHRSVVATRPGGPHWPYRRRPAKAPGDIGPRRVGADASVPGDIPTPVDVGPVATTDDSVRNHHLSPPDVHDQARICEPGFTFVEGVFPLVLS
jgi:hypothetical protein